MNHVTSRTKAFMAVLLIWPLATRQELPSWKCIIYRDQSEVCDYNGGRYFAVVIEKNDVRVRVTLGDKVNEDGNSSRDPTEALGTLGPVWVTLSPSMPCSRFVDRLV